ncbi:GEVED domain-containing protein, partial [Okeania sp. SIO2C9]|uniref:DUF7507 domain-containing protein n=1 Tax=Okeania sp. SIO2C9 TaxID=2607791 RepID=UPI0025F5CD6D
MKSQDNGDAVNLQNGEFGADREVLSQGGTSPTGASFPTINSVFDQRWEPSGNEAYLDHPIFNTQIAPFQGIDYSGNIALTSSDGQISVSNTDIFADLGILTTNSNDPVQSISNADYFDFGANENNPTGQLPTNSAGTNGDGFTTGVNLDPLTNELDDWKTFIEGATGEGTITQNIENENYKDGSGPFVIELVEQGGTANGSSNLSFTDTNGDGVVIIDVNRGGDDWELNNSDIIIDGPDDLTAIFRVNGESNMNMSNTSIQIGEGGIANDDNPFGAIFFKGDSEGNSGDAVFSGNNVVFNGIAFWELDGGTNDNGQNEIDIQNGQGCAQFIGDTVLHSDSRFNLCTVSAGEQPELLDFGDLTDNYQTLLANGGPSHVINPNIQIGALIDDETDGQPSANADGDGNDEDGVSIPTLTAGENATFEVDVTNNTGSDATLYGFIDWNNDGDFDDTGETVTTTVSDGTTNGTASLNFSVPNGAATNTPVGARFRLSTDSGLDATGAASDGEVEDYLVTVQEEPDPSIDIEKSTNGEDADTPTGPILSEGDTVTFTYNVTNDGDVSLENVVVTDDQGLVPVAVDADNDTFNDGDTNQDNILDPGETWEYTASTTVTAGQYTNIGSVTADPVGGEETVTDSDPSNHFGACLFETVFNEKLGSTDEAIDVVIGYGADFNGDGFKDIQVTLRVADASNSSTEDMIGVAFDIDDQNLINTLGLTIDDITTYANNNSGTSDSVISSPVAGTDFIIGPDAVDSNNLLGVNLSGGGVDRPYDALVKFGNGGQGDGIVQEGSFIISGTQDLTDDLIREILEQTDWYVRLQSTNGGNGSAKTAGFISEIPDKNPPPAAPAIDIEKSTNGEDADTATGPQIAVGDTANFEYVVTNTGDTALGNVTVTDDQGVEVTFQG